MNINGFPRSRPIADTDNSEARSTRHCSTPPEGEAPSSTRRLTPGQLFSELQQLALQDPEKFKEIAESISTDLEATADSSSGRESRIADGLAERFEQAAQSGDLSAFRPERGSPGIRHDQHHHHHHHHRHHNQGGIGGSDAIRSVLENALNLVHQAIQTPPAGTAAPTAPTETPAAGSTGSTDTTSTVPADTAGSTVPTTPTTPTPGSAEIPGASDELPVPV